MSRYLWKHHDKTSHTLEQVCLELDEATGDFTFTEGRAYGDWGDRFEERKVRRGTFTRRDAVVLCRTTEARATRRGSDHETGDEHRSDSTESVTETLAFRVTAEGGLDAPAGLALATSASGRTMLPSAEPLHTLFPETAATGG